MFVRQFTGFLLAGLIAAVLLAVDVHILTSPDVASPKVRKMIEETLDGRVEIGSVDLQELGVIRCRNLSIRPPAMFGPGQELRCENILIDYSGIPFAGNFTVTRITIRGMKADVSREAVHYWARQLAARAIVSEAAPVAVPAIRIERAQIRTNLPEVLAPGHLLDLDDIRLAVHPLDGGALLAELDVGGGLSGAWSGRVRYTPGAESIAVDIRCPDFDLRESLARRLKPDLCAVWEKYFLEGPFRIEARIDLRLLPKGRVALKDWGVRMGLLRRGDREVTGRYQPFPYPLRGMEGEVELLPGGVRIHGIRGRTAEGDVFIRGSSSGYPIESAVDIHALLTRLRLDDTVRDAAPPTFQALWRDLALSGLVDVDVRATREEGPDRPTRFHTLVRATDAAIRHAIFPYRVEHIRGEILYDDGAITLRQVSGTHGEARVILEGSIPALDRPGGLDLVIRARGVPFDADLHAALPESIRPLWDLLSPTGHLDATWRIDYPSGPNAEPRHRVEVRCRGAGVSYRDFPLPIRNFECVISTDGTDLDISFAKGTYRDAPVTIQGTVHRVGQATETRLSFGAERLPVDKQFREDLPESFRRTLDLLGLTGHLDARIRVEQHRQTGRPDRVSYAAEAQLHACSLEDRFPVRDIHGRVNIEGDLSTGRQALAGVFKLTQARLMDQRVTDLGALFLLDGDRLTFHDVHGTAYDGIVRMPFFAADASTGRYEGSGRADAIDVGLLARGAALTERPVAGRLRGEIEFEGVSGNLDSLRARGRFSVANGAIWEVPLFIQLVRLLNLGPLPSLEVFHTGDVRFHIADRRVWIDHFLFRSDSVNLSGSGWVKLDGKIDLLIDTEFTYTILGEIPGLSELIGLLKRNFVAVRARGTIRNPELRLTAFPMKDFTTETDTDDDKK
jgi:hypothetical protein